jgi:hypothetical protein
VSHVLERVRLSRTLVWLLAVSVAAAIGGLAGPGTAQAAFGISSVSATALNQDGSVDLEAGTHPFEYVVHFSVSTNSAGELEGIIRELSFDLPPGLVGDPQAIPRCTGAQFEGLQPSCPGNTQIGIVEAKPEELPLTFLNLYNMAAPQGTAARIAGNLFETKSFLDASLRPSDYGITVSDLSLPTVKAKLRSVTARIWGVPADPAHDAERSCRGPAGELINGCSSGLEPVPYLTLPTSCTGPLRSTLVVRSVEEPNVDRSASTESVDSGGNPAGLGSCGKVPFAPKVSVRPETNASSSPSGLNVDVHVPQAQVATQPATAHLKNATVVLPSGLVLNPSTANGLSACALEGGEGINLPGSPEPGEGEPAKCPPASKVGTVEVDTPLLDHPLPGAVYIARQFENPFHSLLGLYIAIDDPITGIVAKIPGKVEPDPVTGQLTATFVNNPQLPFEDLKVDFEGGARAPLTTPAVCGTYTTKTDLTPWSTPEGADAFPSDSFQVSGGAQGGACPKTEGDMPNAPSFESGTTTPLAGTYSPFVLKLSRENGSQQFRSLNVTLPPGLTGKLAGLQECSDAQIAVAEGRGNPGDGALEKTSPSCPAGSGIGVVNVGAGSGSPLYVQGHAYLAGPYKGAPLSMVIITPAVAGPFDLGVVVVRSALFINESTAQITVKSDQIPAILQGIPLDVRSIAVQINRNQFTLNPTSCEPMSLVGEALSPVGAAKLSQRFQVGGCKGLEFKPTLKLSFSGQTKRTGNPAVKAVLTQPKGENANVSGATVILPKGMLIDNSHISNPCTRVQFNSTPVPGEGCPAKSVLGSAKVWTPLLEQPEQGKVYFRSNGGERQLPDLVVALRGKIPLQLVGFIDSVGKKGAEVRRVRSRFLGLPDAPVSRFELKLSGGKKGLLENSKNLCKAGDQAKFQLAGQNGKVDQTEPKVQVSCGKKGKKGGK